MKEHKTKIVAAAVIALLVGICLGCILGMNAEKASIKERRLAASTPSQNIWAPGYQKSELIEEVVLNDNRKCFIYKYEEGEAKGTYITDEFQHAIDFAGRAYSGHDKTKIILDDNVFVTYDEVLDVGFEWRFATNK